MCSLTHCRGRDVHQVQLNAASQSLHPSSSSSSCVTQGGSTGIKEVYVPSTIRLHAFPCPAHLSLGSILRSEAKMTFYDDIYPFYPLQRTAFIVSGRLLAIILVFLMLAVGLLLILPGIRGRTRVFWMLRIMTSLFIGVVIVALNFTNSWAEARMTTNATYKSFSNAVIQAEVGLHVGLYGINVTLRGNPIVQFNETINYNEMFSWHDIAEEEYEQALIKGLPNPILYIVEKFTLSSPCGMIFQYSYSGRFASATLWTAFCCWILANILFFLPDVVYAGYMTMATAAFIFFSMASFSTIKNVPRCVFSIGEDSFVTEYSHSFWLALATGVLCTIIGFFVVMLYFLMPEKVKAAFSLRFDSYEDEDKSCPEGYLNSVFLNGEMHLPLTPKVTPVSRNATSSYCHQEYFPALQ
ncbi:dual oxidase maturation factor 2 isoform X3 [Poecilia reticulata]|uniref:dual oxidase maturation factor 2 isoform X3 n=1 Tax=Poecilia reticulata TaxID=8081 RepID=UPI0007EB129F|nr:PREDICTED: dual oxidase maturation factor 1 isoform X3 [Poecilia reticulata]